MFDVLLEPEVLVSLLTLTAMEIVLGVDNIVFITILCGRLPEEEQRKARRIGIGVALISRLGLLGAINWVMSLTNEWFRIPIIDHAVTGKDAILIVGGIFLLGKASHEIYKNVEEPEIEHFNEPTEDSIGPLDPEDVHEGASKPTDRSLKKAYGQILVQVLFLDIVFSLDSVITAVGMVDHLVVMAIAMVVAVAVMMAFAGPIGDFVEEHPSVRLLALSFLILIGSMLFMEGTGQHVSKGYIYAAMGFALFVELINLRQKRKKSGFEKKTVPAVSRSRRGVEDRHFQGKRCREAQPEEEREWPIL